MAVRCYNIKYQQKSIPEGIKQVIFVKELQQNQKEVKKKNGYYRSIARSEAGLMWIRNGSGMDQDGPRIQVLKVELH